MYFDDAAHILHNSVLHVPDHFGLVNRIWFGFSNAAYNTQQG